MSRHLPVRPLAVSLGIVILLTTTVASYAMSEKEFLKQAIEGDNSEIAIGKLAETKGATEPVKSFGKMLVENHSASRTQAATLARQLGVTPPETPTPVGMQQKAQLEKLSGSTFDQQFATDMIQVHQKAIALYQAEANSGHGAVPELARKTIPVLETHLHMAEDIAKK